MNTINILSNSGKLLYSHTCDDNNITKTMEYLISKGFTDFYNANLRDAYLKGINLEYLILKGANLSNTDLRDANLSDANLEGADLRRANLRRANLSNADLRIAGLSNADLRDANLSDANLQHADLREAKLDGVITNYKTIGYHLACPEKGSFIGYKKCNNNVIVTLKIFARSKRSSATSLKCRTDRAKVIGISDGLKMATTSRLPGKEFEYKLGEIVEVKDFDNNRWNECSTGIHFFMNREAAVNYQ